MAGMFGGKMPQPATPKAPDPVRIPTADDPDVMAALRKKSQAMLGDRKGRASTQLDSGSGASAGSYDRTTLG